MTCYISENSAVGNFWNNVTGNWVIQVGSTGHSRDKYFWFQYRFKTGYSASSLEPSIQTRIKNRVAGSAIRVCRSRSRIGEPNSDPKSSIGSLGPEQRIGSK